MAEYGLLEEVRTVPRATSLTSAANVSDTELVVDDAGDFTATDLAANLDGGGTLELNGLQLEYLDVVWGSTEEDSDTIVLAEPLAAGADIGDAVAPVLGGLAAEDWYAVVDMGSGDAVLVPLTYAQRAQWAPGLYAPAVPVQVSEDLAHIEDAPGRPGSVAQRVGFLNTDGTSAEGPGSLTVALTYLPIAGSEHVYWNGLLQPPSEWTRDGLTITFPDTEGLVRAGDLISVAYAYDPAAPLTQPPSPSGGLVSYEASGWKWKQVTIADATDYSATAYDDSAWASAAAPFGTSNPSGYIESIQGWPSLVTAWSQASRMWARRTISATPGVSLTVTIRLNRLVKVYLNGVEVASGTQETTVKTYTIDGSNVIASNVIAFRVTDDTYTGNKTGCYFDVEVTQ